ncbi:MAG: dihydropteroate synthase, partial [Legionellaceae bacterium]
DPGFGFGKSVAHNLVMMKRLKDFQLHGRPLVLGFSRKNTLGVILKQAIEHRTVGGLGLAVFAALQGVSIIRTHDVYETKQALDVLDAVICVQDEGEGIK